LRERRGGAGEHADSHAPRKPAHTATSAQSGDLARRHHGAPAALDSNQLPMRNEHTEVLLAELKRR
jgi:hypothetical protein